MRKQLLAMVSGAAIAVTTMVAGAGSAGAIPVAPGVGPAADTDVSLVQFRDRGGFRGGGGARSFSGGGGMRGFRGGGTRSFRGASNFRARGFQGPSRSFARSGFESRRFAQSRRVQTRSFRRDFDRRSVDRRQFARVDRRWDGDRRRWRGDRRHRRFGRRHFHGHRFLGAVIIGVPFGYAAVSSNPCYDWIYGPRGWGYYWNYDRCPV